MSVGQSLYKCLLAVCLTMTALLNWAVLPASETGTAVIRMKLINANPAAIVTGEEEMAGRSNYFVGNDTAKWRARVSNYAKVAVRGIYRGVDMVYYGNGRQLEYDFNVAAG